MKTLSKNASNLLQERYAQTFAATALIVSMLPISFLFANKIIVFGAPIVCYLIGCYRGLKAVRAASPQSVNTLPILQITLGEVLHSHNLVELNNKARTAILALGKKCPDDEQAVTVLLDILVKAKRMAEAEQISHLFLKLVEQQSPEV